MSGVAGADAACGGSPGCAVHGTNGPPLFCRLPSARGGTALEVETRGADDAPDLDERRVSSVNLLTASSSLRGCHLHALLAFREARRKRVARRQRRLGVGLRALIRRSRAAITVCHSSRASSIWRASPCARVSALAASSLRRLDNL
jgi:hypothetical protein